MEQMIPGFLEEMLKKQYGEEIFAKILAGYQVRRPVTLRVNPLKADRNMVEQALTGVGIAFRNVSWYEDAMIIEGAREPEIQELPIYMEGGIYLQSLSSMLPPLFLGSKAGESVLDMAAAPGGKTTQMAAMTGNQAQITACEKNKARSEKLKYNLEKQGASGTYVMDGVCRTKISKELVERSARTQEELLKKALKLLKSGHEMVYSTCSILKEENEGLLKRVLKSAGGELVPIGEEWTKELPLLPNAMPGTLLVGPDELFEGFFVAKIRKK